MILNDTSYEFLQTFPMYWRFCKCLRIPSCTEDFEFLRFSTCTGDLTFLWDLFFHVLGTYKHFFLYWNFVFYWFLHALRTLNFYDFPLVPKTFFTVFPMYWRLWGFTNFPRILRTLSFYWFHPELGTMSFYLFPCIENFGFYEVSHVMSTLNFYKLPPYTEDFEFPRKCRKSLKIEGFLQGTPLLNMSKIP